MRKEGEKRLAAVITADGEELEADAFVETTGPAGGGQLSALRQRLLDVRAQMPGLRSAREHHGKSRADGHHGLQGGRHAGSLQRLRKLDKRTLSRKLRRKLEKDGVAVVPLPERLINRDKLARKVCRQYALDPMRKISSSSTPATPS